VNTLNKLVYGPPDDQNDIPNQLTPIRLFVVFRNPDQAVLFEKLLRRITRSDLHGFLFAEADINPLLSAIGCVRGPLKQLRKLSDESQER
tara:strand:- start:228 stop:497 length:270 start_codon:yes stop_codon:yes gene_type:complete